MKKLCIILSITIIITLPNFIASANALEIIQPYVFVDRFPGSAQHLGFPFGYVLTMGANINSESTLEYVIAENKNSGVAFDLTLLAHHDGYDEYFVDPWPYFDPAEHLGTWRITAENEDGEIEIAETHFLDKEAKMPYVKDVRASKDPLKPHLTWRALVGKDIPDSCFLYYRIRLLKDIDNQVFSSGSVYDPYYTIPPEAGLTYENLPDTYLRVEYRCWDIDDSISPKIELRSNLFRPLYDLVHDVQ